MRAKRTSVPVAELRNDGAQMSSALLVEGDPSHDRAMPVNLEPGLLGPMVLLSEAESPSSTSSLNSQFTTRRIMFPSLRLYVSCLSVVFVFVALGLAAMI